MKIAEQADGKAEPTHGLFSSDYERLSRETLKEERRTILELRNRRGINDAASNENSIWPKPGSNAPSEAEIWPSTKIRHGKNENRSLDREAVHD